MIKAEVSILIERPDSEVFAFYADPTTRVLWSDHVIAARWITPGALSVGSVFEVTTRQWWHTIRTERKITAYEEDRRLCYEIDSSVLYVSSCQHFAADGLATRYTVRSEGRLKGLYGLLGPFLVQFMGNTHIAKEMTGFKNALERQVSSHSRTP
jgi:hypothetical protein